MNETDHRIKGFVGVMQENIALSDTFEKIRTGRDLRNRLRRIFGVSFLVIPFQTVKLHQKRQIDRPVDMVDRAVVCDLKLFFQKIQDFLFCRVFHFEPDHFAPLPHFQLLLDLL